ncbi:hypothetical protein NX820_08690 [Levilactobacillus brevis]|uniref:hypothetical protein n=1 Tax=Levilactobacillus brevis TaxID=1580 RepID=UPI00216677D9|nr:hypothetical protein [Levilactobacillus brevis]UVW17986.1 hypothetical protein NX820_08690 [Levilactobacillus brevis]
MTKKSYSERKQLISDQAREIKRYRRIAEERQQNIEMLTESKDQINCSFCRRGISIMSSEYDELWYLDPTDAYGKSIQQQNHENVQVDINDSKYPDASLGGSTNAGFWFNYCPMCGRKLAEAQHDTRTD